MSHRTVALVLALAVVASVSAGLVPVAPADASPNPVNGSDPPPEVSDRETFTVRTGSIDLAPTGTICAEKESADVNRVVISEATMSNITLWHEGDNPARMDVPSAETDRTVLYTNGENALVNTLATLNACIPLDQPQPVVLEAYYMHSDTFRTDGMRLQSGPGVADNVPEPGGLLMGDLATGNGSNGSSTVPENTTDDIVENTTDDLRNGSDPVGTANDTTDTLNDTADGAVNGTTDTVDNVTDTVNGTVDNTTGDLNDTVDNTTGTVDDTVNDTTDTVDDTVNDTTSPVGDTNTTGTVTDTTDDTTDTVDETVDSTTDVVNETVDGTTDTVDETVNGTTDAVAGLVNGTTNTTSSDSDDGGLLALAPPMRAQSASLRSFG